MKNFFVESIPLPKESPLRQSMPDSDFEEAYRRCFVSNSEMTASALVKENLSHPPPGLPWLIKIKNFIFQPFGFSPLKPEKFKWVEIDRDTVLVQFNDQHFSAHFSLSIFRTGRELVFANRVRFHNKIGKAYLKLILPLHRRFIKYVLSSIK